MGDCNRQQPAPQVPARSKPGRGPRSLRIERWKNGFGFTLRHFVVYPPESYMVMAKERRLGLRLGNANINEPMDTIFVKAVHEGTPAHAAGLETGDRILSVNGETIVGKTYAQVVQQIHNTPEQLHLLVVPKEEDIIQQYYSDTAHNPKTNVRPRLRSPEMMQDQKRASALSLPGPQKGVINQKLAATPHRQHQSPQPFYSLQHGLQSSDSELFCNQIVWNNRKAGDENRGSSEMYSLSTQSSKWLNERSGKIVQNDQISVIKTPPTFYPNASGCRLSLDGGILDRHESSSSSTLTDDSVIMSRIRKSCEQKEEFLRNTATPIYSQIIAREFYARPQKLQKPVWPPNSPEIENLDTKTSANSLSNDERSQSSGNQVLKFLPNTQERPQNFGSAAVECDPGDTLLQRDSSVSRSQSEESDIVRLGITQPKLHIVSRRAMQFETGQLEEEDRTHFYRSELSRLSAKRNVPNVAVRKQEFERVVREERESLGRDSRSKESCSPARESSILSGNRTVIVGSKQIHVDPPTDFRQLSPEIESESITKPRARSNSAEGWSPSDSNHQKRSVYGASIERAKGEESQRHKAVRQDSYLAAVKPVSTKTARFRRIIRRKSFNYESDESSDGEMNLSKERLSFKENRRPNHLSFLSPDEYPPDDCVQVPSSVPIISTTEVVKRQKNVPSAVDDRSTRRVSYLKATSSDQMNIGLEKESNASNLKSNRKWIYPMLPGDIQRLRRIFEEYSGIINTGGEPRSKLNILDGGKNDAKENLNILKDGWLNCKIALIDGKRAGDRSWKQVWAVLRGPYFSIHKDKHAEQSENTIDVRSCVVDIPQDYTKKKNVFRLKTETETEYLLQAEDQGDLELWKKSLDEQSENSNTLSPEAAHKGFKKLSNLRTRSPTGQSPASKTRKPIQQDQSLSPKSKTWKGKLGKQFRKIQQGSGSPSSPPATYLEGATIKVPIELCPPSSISDYIPLIVERCTSIVEARGLEIVGIYRVPGNTAAVAALTEAVNKGIELISPEDPRWNDVNVISSLLKSFFRNLPDSLFTSELYPKFIEADKISEPKLRMVTIRKLVKELPEHNFETLKHLLYHLKKIVSKSSVNKMETRNLAIVFGPTLLTTGDLISLVTDTSHQCRIVESLISYVDWFFSNDDVDVLENLTLPMSSEVQVSETPSNANLLLGNIHKIEGYSRLDHSPNKDMSPKDIVSSIISAANRKISKGKSKKLEKAEPNFGSETKSVIKKNELKEQLEPSTAVAASIVSSFVGDMVRNSGSDLSSTAPLGLSHGDVIRSYSGLDANTLERIRRFEQETQAMLQRDPARIRRDAEKWVADKQIIEMKLQQAKRELENEDILDVLADNPSDLNKKSNIVELSSHIEDVSAVRRGTSFENFNDTSSNGSLKRFKSNKEESGLRAAASLDSLHEQTKNELSDDGNDLVLSLTKTFDKKLKCVLQDSYSISLEDENKSTTEKSDFENVIEKKSKLGYHCCEKKQDCSSEEKTEEIEEDGIILSKLKIDSKIKEKIKKFEISDSILRAKNAENCHLKRSESLNKPEKPDIITKLKRSESLNKTEKENDFIKLKRSDSSKNDLKRSDSLTKHEKTETNMNKKKQQESGLKRSSSKEKENIMLVKLKRKNGMPDRSIKRRHTVGGTKDFDKLPWLDNRLQSEALENEKSLKGKEKQNLRTSSPDLSSSRLKAAIEAEGLSIEVSLLGSRGNVLATLRKPLIAPAPSGRPQSMPPVSQIFKLPLESHV